MQLIFLLSKTTKAWFLHFSWYCHSLGLFCAGRKQTASLFRYGIVDLTSFTLPPLHVYRWLFWSFDVVVYPFLWMRPWSSQHFPSLYCPSSRTSYPFVPFRDILDGDSAQYEFFFCGCGRTVIVPQIHFLLNITKLSISSTNHPMQFWLHSFTSFNSCCPTVVLIPFFPLSNSLKTSFFGAAPFSWECQKNILKMYIIHIFAKFRMHIVAWNFLTFLKAPTNTHRGFDDLKL